MKLQTFFIVALGSFVGVFAALKAEDLLSHHAPASALTAMPAMQTEFADYTAPTDGPPDFRFAAKKVLPSIVSVDKYQTVESFFEAPSVQETASGSGVVISRDGTIVTNNHVVAGATEVRVRLADHRSFKAEVVGADPTSDIAVIRVKADNLTPIEMGDSSKIEVGQWAVAVGNPLGYDQTVSVGVISNKARTLPTPNGVLVNGIQTDAPINPGNSGGALTDSDGRLIGINSMISSNTGTNIGIGFAIPVNRVKRVAHDILATGHARNPYLGLMPDPQYDGYLSYSDIRDRIAQDTGASDVPQDGVIVPQRGGLDPEGPAAKAGIKPLDVILAMDGTPITNHVDFAAALDVKQPGDTVALKVWSKGKTRTVNVTLTEEPIDS